jgi:hypothetical protein
MPSLHKFQPEAIHVFLIVYFKFVAPSISFHLAKAGQAALTGTAFSVAGIMKSLGL